MTLKAPLKAYISSPDPYVAECWKECVEPVEAATDADFIYEDYDTQDFEARDPKKTYYSYVIRKGLIRKNYLANMVAYYAAKHPDSALKAGFPETFNFELDYAEFLDDSLDEAYELRQEIEKDEKTWIVKPAMGDRAEGIALFKSIDELQQIMDSAGSEEDGELPFRHYVVQEYLQPLLVDSRKFHIRVYIVCLGALKVWVYNDMLALFSDTPYDADSTDLKGHLTNTCAQSSKEFDPRIVQRLSSLQVNVEQIQAGIHRIVHDLFDAAVADPVNFQPLPNAVEFYGLDFLVQPDSSPVLLEVNAYPDFAQTGDLKELVKGLFKDTTRIFGNEEPTRSSLVYDHQLR